VQVAVSTQFSFPGHGHCAEPSHGTLPHGVSHIGFSWLTITSGLSLE